MAGIFDSKSFNAEAFTYQQSIVPHLNRSELKKSAILVGNSDISDLMKNQHGTGYATIAEKGALEGTPVNYDGQTDITATSTKTFEKGVVAIGRAKAWTEKDFSEDITGGVDFDQNVVNQTAEYWDNVDCDTIVSILKGIFAMTGTQNLRFVNYHTTDISGETGEAGLIGATTVNTAGNKACGKNKKVLSFCLMHPDVSTNLENLKLLKYMQYTDGEGVTRDLSIATWNGKVVIVTDIVPTEEIEAVGDTPAYTKYTTYVLGRGAFEYADLGAKVPAEVARNASTNGGETTLYNRQRKVFSPKCISYTKASQASLSPTDAELENGANWELVHSHESVAANRTYIDHKVVPIVRIISRG